jgi:hypothetical protein
MRLGSLHPKYLDARGLAAVWRAALLARAVLRGRTRGYRQHPQLERFRAHAAPLCVINAYRTALYSEACARGYSFDATKIGPVRKRRFIVVSSGQLQHDWAHLLAKLRARQPTLQRRWRRIPRPESHPLFRVRRGSIALWERLTRS